MADADLYRMQLQALLPQGAAWPRDPEATLTALLNALAEELARVDGRALDLIEEADPHATDELLEEWEAVTGLPDPCTEGLADTLQERRAAVVAKLTLSGGQSLAYYTAVADRLGYSVVFEEFRPFVCGISQLGVDPLNGGHDVRFYWRVSVPDPRVTRFRCGVSECSERLTDIDRAEDLECLLGRLKPAHTELLFNYQGA